MRFFEFFLLFYFAVFINSWSVYGLAPNDGYLYVATIVTLTLAVAIIGFICERKTNGLS